MSGPVVMKRRARKKAPEAEALDAVTDGLNASLLAAVEALREMGFGVEAAVEIHREQEYEEPIEYWSVLSWEKLRDEWTLTITHYDSAGPCGESLPVTSGSRDMRVRAAHALPALLEKLRDAARAELARVEAARAAVESFVGSMREPSDA